MMMYFEKSGNSMNDFMNECSGLAKLIYTYYILIFFILLYANKKFL